jgi:hypothetical protein
MGKFAQRCFADVGSAGGRVNAARAEIPLAAAQDDPSVEAFVWKRLHAKRKRPRKPAPETPAQNQ